MCKAPILALPNFDLPFIVECDVLEYGIVVVLMQNEKPISYFSKSLKETNLLLSIMTRKVGVSDGNKTLEAISSGEEVCNENNSSSPKFLLEHHITTKSQRKRSIKLIGYDFCIEYK